LNIIEKKKKKKKKVKQKKKNKKKKKSVMALDPSVLLERDDEECSVH
jgi:hypothetical protein